VSQPAYEGSGWAVGVDFASGLAVEPVAEPVAEPAVEPESAEHASQPTPMDSATSRSSLPYYTGSHSCTSAVTAFVEPWRTVAGAAQHRVAGQEASVIARSAGCSHSAD